jgi:hypothetical protein
MQSSKGTTLISPPETPFYVSVLGVSNNSKKPHLHIWVVQNRIITLLFLAILLKNLRDFFLENLSCAAIQRSCKLLVRKSNFLEVISLRPRAPTAGAGSFRHIWRVIKCFVALGVSVDTFPRPRTCQEPGNYVMIPSNNAGEKQEQSNGHQLMT